MHAEATLLDHWRAALRSCRGLVDSHEEAEDCASAALVQLLTQSELPRSPEAFMVAAGKCRAIDSGRAKTRSLNRDARVAAGLHDVVDVAEAVVARAEARWACELVLPRLSADERAILALIASGHSVSDAAVALGISKRGAESHLHRARKTARALLQAALMPIGLLGAAIGRWWRAAPSSVALSAVVLVLLPLVAAPTGAPPSKPVRPPLLQGSEASRIPATRASSPSHASSLRGHRPLPAVRKASTHGRPKRAAVDSLVRVGKGNSGDHESTTVDVIMNCVRDFKIEPTGTIGCAGPSS